MIWGFRTLEQNFLADLESVWRANSSVYVVAGTLDTQCVLLFLRPWGAPVSEPPPQTAPVLSQQPIWRGAGEQQYEAL